MQADVSASYCAAREITFPARPTIHPPRTSGLST